MLARRTMPHPLPPKKEVALALLERSSVHVHLDPRAAGVVVPPWLKRQPQLVLQVGLNMPVPIPDLRLDDGGVTCTLSFNRAPFYCVVPWTSVYAMVGDDGRGMVWPDDVPPEVAQPRESQARPERASPAPAATVATLPAKNAKSAKKSADASAGDGKTSRASDGSAIAKPKAKRTAKKKATGRDGGAGEGTRERVRTGAGGGASAKERGEDGRAMLVAVPAADRAGERGERASDRKGSRDKGERDLRERGPSGSNDDASSGKSSPNRAPAPAPSPARAPSGQRPGSRPAAGPKRELPPYLRVVK